MAPGKLDSLDADSLKPLVQQLLMRIDDLLAQNKALLARVAELEAKLGQPPKTPDNSSLPPSRGQKANAAPPATKPPAQGPPWRGTPARREPRCDAPLLRRALQMRCRARRSRTGPRQRVRSYRHSADQAGHDAHRAVPRHVPVLQGTRDGKRPHRYARGHAVRSGHRVDRLPTCTAARWSATSG